MAGLPSVRQVIERNEPAVGTTLKSIAPNNAEALGCTPLDFLFIDRQHGSVLHENLEHVVRAADLNDLPVIVRVPSDDLSIITYLLDVGVAGIMLPQIENPETVIEASKRTRFSDGRSIATTSRAAEFGACSSEEYVDYVNNEIALIPQLETQDGVGVASQVASLDESSFIAIGPGDLSKSLNADPSDEIVQSAIDDVFEAGSNHGCGTGIFVSEPSGISEYDDAAFVIYNSDVGVVMDHFNRVLS